MTLLEGLSNSWRTVNQILQRLFSEVRSKVLMPLLGSLVGIVVVARLTGMFTGPDNYLIYFIGPLGGDSSLVKMENVFRKAAERSIHGVSIKFDEIDDSGDPAIAKSVAMRLAKRDDTLMVVGHVLSSTTKEALPVYMSATPQIPLILTTETNPQILPERADPDQEFPIFRLSPTDDDQALSAYEFAAQTQKAEKFWVVEGSNNAVYTRYLAGKFLENAQNSVTKVLLVSSVLNPPGAQMIEQLGVQWVFFAGDWQGALTLIREVRGLHLSRVNFILSDGCVGAELLKYGGSDVEGVYVMHQLQADEFQEPGLEQRLDDNRGYGLYSTYALEIIDRLLKKADQRFTELARAEVGPFYLVEDLLRMHRVSDARKVLVKCMNRSMGTPFRMSNGKEFRFRKDGTQEKARFNIWKVQGGRFEAAIGANAVSASTKPQVRPLRRLPPVRQTRSGRETGLSAAR